MKPVHMGILNELIACGRRPRTHHQIQTPGGSPACSKISTTFIAVRGVNVAGLNTTALPHTSAGAIFHTGIATGKFHGVITPTTPSGWRIV